MVFYSLINIDCVPRSAADDGIAACRALFPVNSNLVTPHVLMTFIKRILIVARNAWLSGMDYPFYRFQRKLDTRGIRKILLIRQDRLGDIIVSMPAFEAIAKEFAPAVVHLLVAPCNRSLLDAYPFAAKVCGGFADLEAPYDLAVNFLPGYRANRVLAKIDARIKLAYAGKGGACFLTHCQWNDRNTRPLHEIDRNLEFAERLLPGKTFDRTIHFGISEREQRRKRGLLEKHGLQEHPFVVMHPGASRDYLRWPAEHYASLAERLTASLSLRVVITHGHGDDAVISAIRRRTRAKTHCFKIEDLSDLKILYSEALLYIGNVTGPMHLAVSQNIPVVAVSVMKNNVDDMRYWGPRGVHDVVVYPDEAYEAVDFDDGSCARLLSAIPVEKVYAAVIDVLRRRQPEIEELNDRAGREAQ